MPNLLPNLLPFSGEIVSLVALALVLLASLVIGWIAAEKGVNSWLTFFLSVAIASTVAFAGLGLLCDWVEWKESDGAIAQQVVDWPGEIAITDGNQLYTFESSTGYSARILRRKFAPKYAFTSQVAGSLGIAFSAFCLLTWWLFSKKREIIDKVDDPV